MPDADRPAALSSNSVTAEGATPPALHRAWYDTAVVRVLAMLALFCTAPAYERFHLSALSNVDIWWHLRTGLWMLQNHAIPRDGLFSLYAKLPWVDSTLGFDLLTAAAYQVFGLRGFTGVANGPPGRCGCGSVHNGARIEEEFLAICFSGRCRVVLHFTFCSSGQHSVRLCSCR